jgi:Flp pilus assembly protein TadB
MTETIREMTARSRNALPRNRYELIAWFYTKLGPVSIVLIMLAAVWWQGERRNDEMRDIVKANVAAFQQVSADLQSQRLAFQESNTRMRESVETIMQELRSLRHSSSATTSTH